MRSNTHLPLLSSSASLSSDPLGLPDPFDALFELSFTLVPLLELDLDVVLDDPLRFSARARRTLSLSPQARLVLVPRLRSKVSQEGTRGRDEAERLAGPCRTLDDRDLGASQRVVQVRHEVLLDRVRRGVGEVEAVRRRLERDWLVDARRVHVIEKRVRGEREAGDSERPQARER